MSGPVDVREVVRLFAVLSNSHEVGKENSTGCRMPAPRQGPRRRDSVSMTTYYDTIVPRIDMAAAVHLLREDQRLAQFAESERRVGNRTCAPGQRDLPPTYRAWSEGDA